MEEEERKRRKTENFKKRKNVLAMSHRTITTRFHAFRVNVDRLPAARDKALSIRGRLLRANDMKLLSARE